MHVRTGTGKSITGAHIAYTFVLLNKMSAAAEAATAGEFIGSTMADSEADLPHLKCVLYCGPSNVSVDVVLSKFQLLCICAVSCMISFSILLCILHNIIRILRSPASAHQKLCKAPSHSPHVWEVN